jgi:hypothetical protein
LQQVCQGPLLLLLVPRQPLQERQPPTLLPWLLMPLIILRYAFFRQYKK